MVSWRACCLMDTNTPREVSVQEGYSVWAAQYDQDDNALIRLEEQLTIPLLAPLPKQTVLDLGTGTGRYAIRLAEQGARVVALDQSRAMLAIAEGAAAQAGVSIQFMQQSLDTPLPLDSYTFDLLIAALVLSHVEPLEAVLREAYRVLRPGGHFLVTDFHPAAIAHGWRTQFTQSDTTYLLPTAQHTREHYLKALQGAGFVIQTIEDALVRDAPADALPPEIIAQDGDIPFCLVILASKPSAARE
jgi:ubiquinone/menaquinone biosynthesis C-methylase UbiE